MKNNLLTLLLLVFSIAGFSQNSTYNFQRLTPGVKKEKLNEANYLSEMMPGLWRNIFLTYGHYEMDRQVRLDYAQGNYVYPQPESFIYPYESYNRLIDYVSVEISAIANGKTLSAQSPNDKLTTEQKNILAAADLGTDVKINIQFKYKNPSKEVARKIINGEAVVTVVPETEAEYPGGVKQVAAYFMENVINKLSEKSASEKVQQAIVKFTVDEEGEIVNAKISKTSTDPKIDKLL